MIFNKTLNISDSCVYVWLLVISLLTPTHTPSNKLYRQISKRDKMKNKKISHRGNTSKIKQKKS